MSEITIPTGLKRHRNAALAASLVVLAGCAGTFDAEPLATSSDLVPNDWSIGTEPLSIDVARYWTLLGDRLLDRFVEQAIAENRDIASAAARLRQAEAGVKRSRAAYLPRIDAGGNANRNFGNNAPDDIFFNVGADARWEIDLFGRIRNDVAASRADLAAAGFSLGDLQRAIVGQVAQTTISARALSVQLVIARSTLQIQEENLQIARWRLQAGLVSSLDVEQALVQRSQTAASIPAIESDLAAAANTISTLIGEAPGRVRELLLEQAEAAQVPKPPEAIGIDAPSAVLRRRPDVRAAEAQLMADTARIGVARAQLLPLVQLTGNIGSSSNPVDDLFDIITGGLFASVSQLIFDGGATRANVSIAEEAAAASLANWEQAILLTLQDVESSSAAMEAARQRVVLFDQALEAANNAALIARNQYQAGLIDFSTLLISESQLLSARNSAIASEAERANAYVRLTQAMGGGWDPAQFDFPEGQTP